MGTSHRSHICTKDHAIKIIKKIPEAYSEPFADSSQIPTMLVSEIASQEVKVVLTGDSGDELFGGYNRYSFTNHYWKHLKFTPSLIKSLAAKLMNILPTSVVKNLILKPMSIEVSGNIEQRINQFSNKLTSSVNEETFYRSFLGSWQLGNPFINKELIHSDLIALNDDFSSLGRFHFIEKMMIFDFKTYMTDDILCKVDRGSMFSSLETRVPFLDKDVIKFSASVPLEHKIKGLNNKVILKKLLGNYLPDSLINRPKMGFGVPVHDWIISDLRDWSEELLSREQNNKHNLFDYEMIIKST